MTPEMPEWDAQDMAGSLERFAAVLNEQARTMFEQDGTHVQLVFIVLEDGERSLQIVPPGTTSEGLAVALRDAIRQHPICGIVLIAEAWAYFPKGPGDHTQRQIILGEMNVSDLRPEDWREILLVWLQSRVGANRCWASPIRRTGDQVKLEAVIESDQPPGGRLARLFEA